MSSDLKFRRKKVVVRGEEDEELIEKRLKEEKMRQKKFLVQCEYEKEEKLKIYYESNKSLKNEVTVSSLSLSLSFSLSFSYVRKAFCFLLSLGGFLTFIFCSCLVSFLFFLQLLIVQE
jgi:hypothetical protein